MTVVLLNIISSSCIREICPRMRMSLIVNCPEAFYAHVRVNLGRRQACMPEQLLYIPEIRSSVKEMRGKTMPQGVGTY